MILTKQELCKSIISQHYNTITYEDAKRLVNDSEITQSSNLAVAMETLGLIKDETMKRYAESRGGIILPKYINKTEDDVTVKIMSLRDLLSLLPSE